MELTWMGRYRKLVHALVLYSNTSNKSVVTRTRSSMQYALNQHSYQVLEYVCEHEDENHIMADISNDLGIIRSNVTSATKDLLEKGLIEKYRIRGNKKSIILKPTGLGKQVYMEYCEKDIAPAFQSFFDSLETLSDEDLATVEKAVTLLSSGWNSGLDEQLEKYE